MPDWQSDNYEVVADGPTPTSWDEYAQTVSAEWDRVLADPNVGEPEMHDFLEKHPCMVPGHDAFNAAGLGRLPAGPIRACLFSKPPLPESQDEFRILCGFRLTAKPNGWF